MNVFWSIIANVCCWCQFRRETFSRDDGRQKMHIVHKQCVFMLYSIAELDFYPIRSKSYTQMCRSVYTIETRQRPLCSMSSRSTLLSPHYGIVTLFAWNSFSTDNGVRCTHTERERERETDRQTRHREQDRQTMESSGCILLRLRGMLHENTGSCFYYCCAGVTSMSNNDSILRISSSSSSSCSIMQQRSIEVTRYVELSCRTYYPDACRAVLVDIYKTDAHEY